MIPLLLAALVGGIILVANWDKVVDWLQDFIPKLKKMWESVRMNIPHGARLFGDIIVEGADRFAKIMHKLYYKENGQWIEETTARKVDESEVPAAIRNKINYNEADITEEIEEEIEMEV